MHAPATQTVFGQGPTTAWLVLVGEQRVKHFRPDGGVADARELARFLD